MKTFSSGGALRAPKTAVMDRRYSFCCWALWCLLVAIPVAQAGDLAARVVILANSRDAESVALAEFYAGERGVPRANIIALPLPEEEDITWRTFIDQVYQPVQDELHRRGWLEGTASSLVDSLGRKRYGFTGHRIAYLVTCRGVPLRISNDPLLLGAKPANKVADQFHKNEAAVDSELSLLAQSGTAITGLVANPLFGNERPSAFQSEFVVKVSRLDGPTFASARRLVTAAREGEQRGLLGRYYVDLQGPHADGDKWLEATRSQLDALGFDGDSEQSGATLAPEARFDAPVLYFGWYAGNVGGPFAVEGFTFPPGAIAVHIHSFSAQTMHSDTSAWGGPLVARGVAATVGNVFEPYLQFTHRPHLLLRALSQGKTFGDAAYFALPALSWQAVAIGDPLYRPFQVALESQEQAAGSLPPGLAPYAVLRRAKLLTQQKKSAEALAVLRTGFNQQPSLVAGLALAQASLGAGDLPAAVSALGFVTVMKSFRPEDWALARQAAVFLSHHEDRRGALAIYSTLAQTKAPTPEAHKALLQEARNAADAAGNVALSLKFARQLNELTVVPAALPPAKK
jgi:uncharacterized protein (TIGR03790 family)